MLEGEAFDTGITEDMAKQMGVDWSDLRHRRTGKSTGQYLELIGSCLRNPGEKHYLTSEDTSRRWPVGYQCQFPTIKMASIAVPEIWRILEKLELKGFLYNKSEMYFVYLVKQLLPLQSL